MRWEEFDRAVPSLARIASDRLIAPGVLLVVTIRRDGTPRLSPVEPLLLDGDLWLSMMWQSRKAGDLQRDPRVLIHSITTRPAEPEPEIKLRGHAVAVDNPQLRRRYCEQVDVLGWRPIEPYFHLFRIDIADTSYVRYAPNGDQHVARWPAGVEFVRRATSPTSVGAPEPIRRLLEPE